MADQIDLYATLGVAPTSEHIVVQAAYRALMRRYHPDTNRSSGAAKRAQEINEAYRILSDPALRAAYDRKRTDQSSTQRDRSPPPPPPPPPPHPQTAETKRPTAARPSESETGNRRGLKALGVYVVLVLACGATYLDMQSTSGEASATFDADSMTMANQDLEPDNEYAMLDANSSELVEAQANSSTPDTVAQATPLSEQAPDAVDYAQIEEAAEKFASVLMKDGVIGARSYSERCHAEVKKDPSWQKADYCAAFDVAARTIDQAITSQTDLPENGYFKFQNENQADRYVAAGAPSYVAMARLRQIEGPAAAAGRSATSAALARMQAHRKHKEPDQTTDDAGEADAVTTTDAVIKTDAVTTTDAERSD